MLLNNIKELITKIPVLTHFDTSKEITIECDASEEAVKCRRDNPPMRQGCCH